MNKNISSLTWIIESEYRKKSPKKETVFINLEAELRNIISPNIKIKINNGETKKESNSF